MGLHFYHPDLNQVVQLDPKEEFEIVGCVKNQVPCGKFNELLKREKASVKYCGEL